MTTINVRNFFFIFAFNKNAVSMSRNIECNGRKKVKKEEKKVGEKEELSSGVSDEMKKEQRKG